MDTGITPQITSAKRYPIWLNLWFWWVVFTAFYLVGQIFGFGGLQGGVGILGVFVPFGIWNTMAGWYLIPVFLLALYFFERWLKRLYLAGKISLVFKIILGVLFLVISTAIIDIVFWHCWQSIFTAIGSMGCVRF